MEASFFDFVVKPVIPVQLANAPLPIFVSDADGILIFWTELHL